MTNLMKQFAAIGAIVVAVLATATDKTLAQSVSDNAAQVQPEGTLRYYKVQLKHGVPVTDNSTRKGPANASAPASPHLTYYGGRVVGNAQVIQVLWGNGSYLGEVSNTGTPSMASFYQQLLTSSYVNWLDTEYNTAVNGGTNQHIGEGKFVQQITITPSTNALTIDDTQIQTELVAQIKAGHLPEPTVDAQGNPNTYYAVFFPPGITITQGGASSCSTFCAYHGTIANTPDIYYGVHPDLQPPSACAIGCGPGTTFENYTSLASKELTGTITDAEVGLATSLAAPLAWYDSNNGEIGDICNAQQGTFVGGDQEIYTLQLEFSNAQSNCINPTASFPANNFSISASPTTLTLAQNASGTSTISTAVTLGAAGTVSLVLSGLPAGATGSLSPASVTAGGGSTLTVNAGSAAPGTYVLAVTGVEGAATHSTSVTLTIPAPVLDFTIAASPSSFTVAQNSSGGTTITTTAISGAGTVSLSLSGLPAGVTGSVSPASVAAGSNSTLTVNAGNAVPGTYTLTVTGIEGANTHSIFVTLVVAASDFTIAASPTSLTLNRSASGTSTISTVAVSGAGTVSLALSGLPAGATGSLSPTSVPAGGRSTLTVNSGSAAPGTYTVTVAGNEGTHTHSTAISLTIRHRQGHP